MSTLDARIAKDLVVKRGTWAIGIVKDIIRQLTRQRKANCLNDTVLSNRGGGSTRRYRKLMAWAKFIAPSELSTPMLVRALRGGGASRPTPIRLGVWALVSGGITSASCAEADRVGLDQRWGVKNVAIRGHWCHFVVR